MAFVFDGKHSVIDKERNIIIAPDKPFGDRVSRAYRYKFSQGDFWFHFYATSTKISQIYKNRVTGADTEVFSPQRSFIMEELFQKELLRRRSIAGLPKLEPDQYQIYCTLVKEGMAVLATMGGLIPPTADYQVDFLPNEQAFDALYPLSPPSVPSNHGG
jgi:hypothetical protein